MSIQKINIGGTDVEIEDAVARQKANTNEQNVTNLTSRVETNETHISSNTDNITTINNTIGSDTLQTTAQTLKGAINEVKQSIGESGGGMSASYNSSTNTLTIA